MRRERSPSVSALPQPIPSQDKQASPPQSWRPRHLATLLLTLLCLLPSAFAQNKIHVPADQPTIQAAIDAANPGDTVLVAPGTYYENIDFKGKAITVTSSDGPATTIIDGGSTANRATVLFQRGESRNSVISKLTIKDGAFATVFGASYGGVYVSGAAPTILNNIITSNECNGVYVDYGAALIQGNTISDSDGPLANGVSGYCSFPGAGILVIGEGFSTGSFTHSDIIGNTIEGNIKGVLGGGILVFASAQGTLIQNNIIRNNIAGNGSAIGVYGTQTIIIDGNLIYGNSSNGSYQYTGAVSLTNDGTQVGPFDGYITNNTIVGNTLTNFHAIASQLYLTDSSAQYSFVNNIIVGTTSLPALYCQPRLNQVLQFAPMPADHNDIFNAKGPSSAGSCTIEAGSNGNLSVDPRFTSDYHLSPGSSAIDAGNTSVFPLTATDAGGNQRVQDATSLGYAVIDMGAYEYSGVPSPIQTTLAVTPSEYDQLTSLITLTGQITSPAGTPTGLVTFLADGVAFATATIDPTGKVTATTESLALGLHEIVANYPGQGAHSPAVSVPFFILIDRLISPTSTTTKLTSSLTPANYGQSVTFTALVTSALATSGSPTGTVTFLDGNTLLATEVLTVASSTTATASFSISTLAVGLHPITATYLHNASLSDSNDSLTQVVNGLATNTKLTSSLDPSSYGQSITFTANVTGPPGASSGPTGSIVFTDGAAVLGTQPLTAASGSIATASYSTTTLSVGTHIISASYVPTGNFAASKDSRSQTVTALASSITFTASPSPQFSSIGVLLTATVTSSKTIPTGTVIFSNGTTVLTSQVLDAAGQAMIPFKFLPGTYSLTATYGGNSIYSAVTSTPVTEVILPDPADFSITLASPTMTIQTQHHLTTTVTLTSLNGFADSLAVACANLPKYVTCRFTTSPTALAANGTATVSLSIDTDSVLGYALLQPSPSPRTQPTSPINFALLLCPFGLFAAIAASHRRRSGRRRHLRLLVLLLAAIPLATVLSGCGSLIYSFDIPASATAGTYTIPIAASGANTGSTHTTQLTLIITP